MFLIEDIDSLNIGISKIEKDLQFLTKIYKSNQLAGNDQNDLELLINRFNNSLGKLKLFIKDYNSYSEKDQQNIMNVAYDLYNDVKYLKDILNQI
jgi:hypothetical protein